MTSRKGPHQDKIKLIETLEHLDWHQNKGTKEIAKELGVHHDKVRYWLSEFAITNDSGKVYRVKSGGKFDFTSENIETGRL